MMMRAQKKKQRKEAKINYITKSTKSQQLPTLSPSKLNDERPTLDTSISSEIDHYEFEAKVETKFDLQEDFEEANYTYLELAGKLKKGSNVMLKDDKPCKLFEYSSSKAGKHGSAKMSFGGHDIFTGKKYYDSFPSHQQVRCPFVEKYEVRVVEFLKKEENEEKNLVKCVDKNGDEMNSFTIKSEYDSDFNAYEDRVTMEELEKYEFDTSKSIFLTFIKAMGKTQLVGYRAAQTK